MKVGSLVFATEQGLGYLAKDFVDHGIVTDVMVVAHGKRPEQNWYPGVKRLTSLHSHEQQKQAAEFVRSMDVMLYFETPFLWELLQEGPSILMPMHECMPKVLPAIPSIMACPSDLDFDLYNRKGLPGCKVTRVDVPVEQRWYQRDVAKVFVHNAGHGGLKGRNGTKELLDAMMLVKNPVHLILRSQDPILHPFIGPSPMCGDGPATVSYRQGTILRDQLYLQGDVFVFPEAFNGLSLPLQEAYASGMAVMATDRFPNNTYLPREPLIPVLNEVDDCISQRLESFDRAIISPKNIAKCIDEWYGRDISELSRCGREWAKAMSWEVQKSKWLELLHEVCKL